MALDFLKQEKAVSRKQISLEDMARLIWTSQGVDSGKVWKGYATYSWKVQDYEWTISGAAPGPYLLTGNAGNADHAMWARIEADLTDADIMKESQAVFAALVAYSMARRAGLPREEVSQR